MLTVSTFSPEPRTQAEYVKEMYRDLKEIKTVTLPAIKAQTTKTNGRVTKLELAVAILAALLIGYLTAKGIHLPIPLP